MKISNKNFLIGVGAIVLGVIIYFIIQKDKIDKLETKNKSLEDNNDNLDIENHNLKEHIKTLHSEINEIIEQQHDLSESVKKELKKLIENYQNIDEEIRNELISANALMEIKQDSKATLSLVKIIENLFKKIYNNNEEFNAKYSKSKVLDNYIEFAKEKEHLTKDEYHFMKGVKELRNKEAHKPGVKLSELLGATAILIGLQLIFKLSRLIT